MILLGMPIIEDKSLVRWEQTRFPRSKRRRIRKKWRKRYAGPKPDPKVYLIRVPREMVKPLSGGLYEHTYDFMRPGGHYLIGHPATIEKLKKQLHRKYEPGRVEREIRGEVEPKAPLPIVCQPPISDLTLEALDEFAKRAAERFSETGRSAIYAGGALRGLSPILELKAAALKLDLLQPAVDKMIHGDPDADPDEFRGLNDLEPHGGPE